MIVHVGPSNLRLPALRGGAVERRMMELAEAQARTGEPIVVYSTGPETAWRDYRGVHLRYLPGTRAEFALHFIHDVAHALACRRGLQSPLRASFPRVIHVHNRAEIAWLAKRARLAPTVLSCDYHYEPLRRLPAARGLTKSVYRRCLVACNRIAPVSRYCLDAHRDYWHLPEDRFAIIPNGVDCARFRPDPALRAQWRARLGVDRRPVVLYVGRLCEQKGTDVLLAAYRALRQPAALIVAGPCERFGQTHVSPLVEQVRAAGGTYLPPLDDADMPAIYNACDLFVMPTRDLEMFGMAAVEAQACGKPVVASDHGGLRETVPDAAGLRFRSGDPGDFAAKLDTLLANPDRLRALAAGAAANAAQYDWPRIVQRCEEVYATL